MNQGAYIDFPNQLPGTPAPWTTHYWPNQIALPLLNAAFNLIKIARLQDSAEQGYSEVVECWLKTLGEGLNARRYADGNTALHLAIKNGNKPLITALIDKGASLEIINHDKETPFQLALNSKDPYIIALVHIAKIRKLSLALESEEQKESKETLESKDIVAFQEQLAEVIKIVLDDTIKELPRDDKSTIYFLLGEFLSKPNTASFQPILAYELLNQVDKKNLIQFQKANTLMFQLLIGGQIILHSDLGLEDDEENQRHLRLRAEIRHLILSDSEDELLLGKLIAEYALGTEHSLMGIKGISGRDIDSQLELIDKMREMNLENMKLKQEIEKAKKREEALEVAKKRDLEKFEREIAELKNQLETRQSQTIARSPVILSQFSAGGPLLTEQSQALIQIAPKI